jgi:hypothetical protein
VHTFPNFLSPELAAALLLLQSDANFLLALHSHRSLIQLQDCWLTFSTSLQEYPKWGSESWVPTADECIAARVRTSGIVEEQFVIDEVVRRARHPASARLTVRFGLAGVQGV